MRMTTGMTHFGIIKAANMIFDFRRTVTDNVTGERVFFASVYNPYFGLVMAGGWKRSALETLDLVETTLDGSSFNSNDVPSLPSVLDTACMASIDKKCVKEDLFKF